MRITYLNRVRASSGLTFPAADRSRLATIFQNGWRLAERDFQFPGHGDVHGLEDFRGDGAGLWLIVGIDGQAEFHRPGVCLFVWITFCHADSLPLRGCASFSARRFAACASGLACGLALAVRPAGSPEAPRARLGPEDPSAERLARSSTLINPPSAWTGLSAWSGSAGPCLSSRNVPVCGLVMIRYRRPI